jgi:hypothetical protein
VIDFRFFLISIVAVFLALGIGIVMGSGVLRDPIFKGLESRADAVVERNDDLRNEISNLENERAREQDFMDAIEPELVAGELIGEDVVMIQLEGTDGSLVDSIEDVVVEGGGEMATTIVLTRKFALESKSDEEALAEVIRAQPVDPASLREAAGSQIGARLGASASQRPDDPASGIERGRAIDLLQALEDEGFATIDRTEDQPIVPSEAVFVIAAGSGSEPAFDPGRMVVMLASRIDDRGSNALVVEPTDSVWGAVAVVRDDSAVANRTPTVDHGETTAGRVAIAWSLPEEREVGHWGTDDGADAIVPAPPG